MQSADIVAHRVTTRFVTLHIVIICGHAHNREMFYEAVASVALMGLFLHVTFIYDYVILCHCTLAAAFYFEQSSCDELMEFKQIQTKAQPEESLKHNHSCTNMSSRTRPLLLVHSGDRFVQLWLGFNDSALV